MKKFPIYRQLDAMDCGPACLKMIAKFHGKNFSLEELRQLSYVTRNGTSVFELSEAAEKIGFKSIVANVTFDELDENVSLPCIVHWKENHFVIVTPQDYDPKSRSEIEIADPAFGLVKVTKETFLKCWVKPNENTGIVIILDPTVNFFSQERPTEKQLDVYFLFNYLKPYKKFLIQLLLGMVLGSVLSLVIPFLTQSLVDYGVNHKNIGFIQLILISQVGVVIGMSALEMIRSWIVLHMNSRINISIISDFLIKLMKLPVKFFDSKRVGDVLQRIADNGRIEGFLTNTLLNTVFSLVTLIVFAFVLFIYSKTIAIIFFIGSIFSVLWITLFLNRRKNLDYLYFQEQTLSQTTIYELIVGMQDIKLHNSELTKRWEWERAQVRLFNVRIKNLTLEQYQKVGNLFFLQIKNILVSYFAATAVVRGEMTIGMMLSVSYIIGQMNSPIEQLLGFIRSAQDAKISLERLNEIHQKEEEEKTGTLLPDVPANVDFNGDIKFENVDFRYGGESTPLVLKNATFVIPHGKVTAVVGMSGSGKTTLLKMLLKFYEPVAGSITFNKLDARNVSPKAWRQQCGVVVHDGLIFSDTIAKNIALGAVEVDSKRLDYAVKIANIQDFIAELPLGYNTKIGNTGTGISAGQKLRILIARAVYKDPRYIFLDEATSVLDAKNERIIMENLNTFFSGRTVLLIAHRLSTVRNADQILVMDKGQVVEVGDHHSLLRAQGKYFDLVRSQLEQPANHD
jgi:ATP-binding cassette subfamily B protein